MKSFKQIVCLAVLLLLVVLLASEALAERPQTREIRDKVKWGDPDSPAWCHKSNDWRRVASELPDRGFKMRVFVANSICEEMCPPPLWMWPYNRGSRCLLGSGCPNSVIGESDRGGRR